MKEFLEPHVIISLAVIIGSLSMVAIVITIVLRDKISDVSLSRSGLRIHTNDIMVWSEMVREIERIDAATRKSICKATMGLMILDPEKHGMTAEVMLVNREANLLLFNSAYENHLTRELSSKGSDVYIANKAQDIFETVQIWRKQFPKLTEEMSENFACYWIKKILIPNIRKACYEKLDSYQSMYARNDVSKILKDEIARCISKNEQYVQDIEDLSERTDIKERSFIFPTQT